MGLLISVLRMLLVAALLLLAALLAFRIVQGMRGPPLKPWHSYVPNEPAADAIDSMDWAVWQAHEQTLFAEVERNVSELLPAEDRLTSNRYWSGAPVHPARLPQDWNRSFELLPSGPARGVAVLLHGLSDSPYSMRHLARHYQARGWAAVVIRLPGHGTVPGGLVRADTGQWRAATRLAVREAMRLAPGRPIHLIGYSNGAALALAHALDSLADPALGTPQALVLLSPLIGLPNPAGVSQLIRIPAMLPATVRLAWLDLLPEYNPFKYNSFPINAGLQADRMTKIVATGLARARTDGTIGRLPRVLAFQSVVDSTVSAQAVRSNLFDRLPDNGSELLLFDVNHAAYVGPLLRPAAAEALRKLLPSGPRHYRIGVVTNAADGREDTVLRTRPPGATAETTEPLDIPYRRDFYSLGHVALPFPLTDGLYGADPDPADVEGARLGVIATRGEQGALSVAPATLARVSSNPFFFWMLGRIDRLIDHPQEEGASPRPEEGAGPPASG